MHEMSLLQPGSFIAEPGETQTIALFSVYLRSCSYLYSKKVVIYFISVSFSLFSQKKNCKNCLELLQTS